MDLKTYLEHRFKYNNINKYQKYRDEWVKNVLDNPQAYNYDYFLKEMSRVIHE